MRRRHPNPITPPALTRRSYQLLPPLVLLSDNANTDGPWATTGDVITLTVVSSETIAEPVVTFKSGGVAITDTSIAYANTTGNTWTAKYTADASDTEGNVTFSVAFQDSSGNVGSPRTTVTDSSTVRFDRTAPILNSVSLSTNNSPSTHAKTGREVTLRIVANDSISRPVVTFKSGGASCTDHYYL